MAIRWSIGRRLAIGIALAVTLGSVALTAAVSLVQYRSQFAREVANARLYTQLIASEAGAAIHLKQAPAVDRKLASFTKAFNRTLIGAATLDAEYKPVSAYQNPDLPAADLAPFLATAKPELQAGKPVVRADGGIIVAAVPAVLGGSTTVGYLATAWSLGELEAGQVSSLETAAGATALVLLIVLTVQVLLVRRYVSLPIGRMTGAMTRLASDDLSVEVPGLTARDEIGDMAKAVEVFKGKAIMVERLHREQAEQEARGRAERQRSMGELADRFENAMAGIVGAVGETAEGLRSNSAALMAAAERSHAPVSAVARISEETASSMTEVVGEADQLNRAIAAISGQVSQSAGIVREAVERAREANTTVASLSEASREVGEIVKLISAIAAQTNLLALNATIEAARAGEAGKGFAVVAQEVKNLATQTTKATEDVGRQITAIQDGTARAVAVIESIGATVERMNSVAASIAAAVVQQGYSTRTITGNLGHSAEAARSLAEQAAEVRALVEQTGQAATILAGAVTELRGRAAMLKDESHSFAASVRAG